jgi:hypothetical protein
LPAAATPAASLGQHLVTNRRATLPSATSPHLLRKSRHSHDIPCGFFTATPFSATTARGAKAPNRLTIRLKSSSATKSAATACITGCGNPLAATSCKQFVYAVPAPDALDNCTNGRCPGLKPLARRLDRTSSPTAGPPCLPLRRRIRCVSPDTVTTSPADFHCGPVQRRDGSWCQSTRSADDPPQQQQRDAICGDTAAATKCRHRLERRTTSRGLIPAHRKTA